MVLVLLLVLFCVVLEWLGTTPHIYIKYRYVLPFLLMVSQRDTKVDFVKFYLFF